VRRELRTRRAPRVPRGKEGSIPFTSKNLRATGVFFPQKLNSRRCAGILFYFEALLLCSGPSTVDDGGVPRHQTSNVHQRKPPSNSESKRSSARAIANTLATPTYASRRNGWRRAGIQKLAGEAAWLGAEDSTPQKRILRMVKAQC